MYVNLKVSNQTLRRTSFEQIVENSVNYLYLKLEASEDWTGTKKRGYFSQNGTMWYISDFNDDNECEVPIEVVKASGFKLYLVARDTNNEVKITTNIIDLNVSKTGNEQGEKPSLTEINSDTLEVSREGNIIRLEIPITYTTDEELQQAILESGNNFNSKLQETKTDLEKKLSNVQEEFNTDVSTLNDTISSNKTALIERMDNLSAEQEKTLENEINNVKTGVTIVNRAINDEDGNNIQRTYPTKIITELNPTNYKLSITLLNKYNKTVSTQEVDFPAESSVVNARLDKSTNTLYLVLRNGNETAVPLSAIIRNLATEDYVVSKIEIISQRIDEEVKSLNKKIDNQKITLDNSIASSLKEAKAYADTKVDKVEGKDLSTNDYANEDKIQVSKILSKATQIKAKLDTTDYLYDKLKIDLLNANSDIISTAEVKLKKSELKYSTFIFNEDDDTCTMKGDCAGTTSMEERLECYPFNELYMENVQLQDSSGNNLEGTDTFLVMPNLWHESTIHNDSKGWTITFANKKVNSNFKRMFESDEITELLLARYKAIKVGNYARSQAGDYPLVSTNQTTFDSYLPYYNGTKIDSNDYRNRILYAMLNVCFTGHRNSQNAYYGITSYVWGDGTTSQYGESLKSGTTDSLGDGLITGEITEFGGTTLDVGKRPFSVLGIENPYGVVWENITGIVHNASGELYAYEGFEHMTPSMIAPSDSNIYYSKTDVVLSTNNEGWQNTFKEYKGYPFPISIGGNSANNVGDYYWFFAGWRIFIIGSSFINGMIAGLFSLSGNTGFGYLSSSIGFRLSLKR